MSEAIASTARHRAPSASARPAHGRRLSLSVLRTNPLVAVSVAGLFGGLVASYGAGAPALGSALWLAVLLVAGLPLSVRTVRDLVRGTLHADVIAALAIVTSLAMGEYLAGAIIVVMQSTGEALERFAFGRASGALSLLIARAPKTAYRLRDGRLEAIDAARVRPGDRLVIKPGDLVPVDARVITGASSVDQSTLTGEPVVVAVGPGSDLLSGSVNTQGALEVEALRPASESQYERIVALVRDAQSQKPPMVRLADRAAAVFTPLTLLMCGIGWLVTNNAGTILSVLVVATPCPLILAVPVAVFAGINRAANRDIIVKNGAAIEQVGRVRAVAFDKTGTLTAGNPEVAGVIVADGYSPDAVLRQAAAVEQISSHQLGRALAAYGERRCGPLPLPEHFVETVARGVRGVVDGTVVEVGPPKIASAQLRPQADALLEQAGTRGAIRSLVLIDGHPAGVVLFADRLRPGVAAMTAALHRMGVQRIMMLTGDGAATAHTIGAEAGVSEVRADLLPPDKVAAIEDLMAETGPTLMVGDGTNDAPALATATVGVAMGAHGTGISAEAADIVLLKDDVTEIVDAVRIGRRVHRVALQSVALGIGLSLALMVIAVFGLIRPTTGALFQEVIDVLAVLNALRARSA